MQCEGHQRGSQCLRASDSFGARSSPKRSKTRQRRFQKGLRKRKEQVRAREWFIEAGNDFQRACDLAGYDAERIRRATVELIDAVKHRDPKPRQQQPRLQKNALHHHEGRSLTIQEWVAETGLNKNVFYAGIKRGKSIGQIINGRGRAANFAENLPDRQFPSTQDIA